MAAPNSKPKQIKTLAQLLKAAEARRSVIVPSLSYFRRPQPAAFVINLQGRQLLKLLNAGMYIYKRPVGPWSKSPWWKEENDGGL
jgi:hypothetical protein